MHECFYLGFTHKVRLVVKVSIILITNFGFCKILAESIERNIYI